MVHVDLACSVLWSCSVLHVHSISDEVYGQYVLLSATDDSDTLGRRVGLRSVVECASYCYTDPGCQMAVYTQHRICLLIGDYDEDRIDQLAVGDYVTRVSQNVTALSYSVSLISEDGLVLVDILPHAIFFPRVILHNVLLFLLFYGGLGFGVLGLGS